MEAFMRLGCKAAIVISYVLVSILSGVWPLAGAERTVWEIGKFDQSSREFTRQIDFGNPPGQPCIHRRQERSEQGLAGRAAWFGE
jgi:hypothetical protein